VGLRRKQRILADGACTRHVLAATPSGPGSTLRIAGGIDMATVVYQVVDQKGHIFAHANARFSA
jgi:hypothetical protein